MGSSTIEILLYGITSASFNEKDCNFEKTTFMSNIEMTAIFEPCDEGGYIAYIEEIPGINSQGETIEEAKENLADAVNLMFEERRTRQKTLLIQKPTNWRNIYGSTTSGYKREPVS